MSSDDGRRVLERVSAPVRGLFGLRRKGWTGAPLAVVFVLSGASFTFYAWGGTDGGDDGASTRLEAYAATLDDDGVGRPDREPAIDAWKAAGRRALAEPAAISLPFRERGRLSAGVPDAAGYRFQLREGQVVEVTVRMSGESSAEGPRHFTELYRIDEGGSAGPTFVAEADSSGATLRHESRTDADYVLRVQPELLGGGAFSVELVARGTFGFPVAERGPEVITSRFGAPRDGGARTHEGLDAVAPRGTPVVAVTKAMVHRVGRSGLGGNHIWLRDWVRQRDIYYAHLDEIWVDVGMIVERGQAIGGVGNTGNAEGTAPHLHFAIYDLEGRPSDPVPYVVSTDTLAPAPDAASR